MVRGEGTWYMHGQGAHLDLCASSSVERYTIWILNPNTSRNKSY